MKYLVLVCFLSGCSFSYSFNPKGQSDSYTKAEISQALRQRDDALMQVAQAVKELQPKGKVGVEKKK